MHTNNTERGIRNDPHANPGIGLPHHANRDPMVTRGHNQPTSTAAGVGTNRAQVGEQTYGRSPETGPAPTTAGHHSHDVLNKLDPRVDSTHDQQGMPQQQQHSTNIPEGTAGPHHSRVANALDPRVDSDMDGSNRAGTGTGMGPSAGGGLAGGEGTIRGKGMHSAPGYEGGHYGSANPRPGSDLHHQGVGNAHMGQGTVGGHHMGASGAHAQPQTHGAGATTGAGMGAGGGAPVGPHKSSLMNKLDPRVDSKTGMKKESGSSGWVAY